MVFIFDDGSTFKAPLDKVWKLNQSEGEHSHPSLMEPEGRAAGRALRVDIRDTDA